MHPDSYASLNLSDMWLENVMQQYESKWIIRQTGKHDSVLDLGYGSGIVCKALAEAGRHVTVVDGAKDFIHEASTIPNVDAVHSMFEDFTTSETFDCVIASFILEHVQEPIKLLKRCHNWSKKLIVVVGNANSIHRQVGVEMKLQPDIYSLSERDKAVGHYMVYDHDIMVSHLSAAGWEIEKIEGFFVKPLNNSRMQDWEPELIHALNRVKISPKLSANIGVVCVPKRSVP